VRAQATEVWSEAKACLHSRSVEVILNDADQGIAPLLEVVANAHSAGSQVILLARELDASRWISLFKSGAFDILRYSVDPLQLYESVQAAINNSRNRAGKHSALPGGR
jgi:DNA-binding NtrC family response regulator